MESDPPPTPRLMRGVVSPALIASSNHSLPLWEGWGGVWGLVFWWFVPYIQLCAPNVVARAVRMVMRMLRILPQVELLLNVPIVLDVLVD